MTAIIHLLDSAPADSQIGQALHDFEQEADHIVELRAQEDTRAMFSDQDEEALFRIRSKIEFVLSSIRVERETIDVRAQAAE